MKPKAMEEGQGCSEPETNCMEIETNADSIDNSMIFHAINDVSGFLLYMHQQIPSLLQDITLEFEKWCKEYSKLTAVEIRQLQLELERERNHHSYLQQKLELEEERKLNESFRKVIKLLNMEKEKSSLESIKVQDELMRKEAEDADDIATVEKENASLKKVEASASLSFTGIEEMELFLRKLDGEMKEA
ncbi:hypothetical protein CsatB_022583 [Cannabis sativa]